MRAELEVLRSTILRVGLLAAGMACSPEERLRLKLLAHEDPAGITTANIQELHRQVLQITHDAGIYAQAAVDRHYGVEAHCRGLMAALAAPDDPRRQATTDLS